MQRRNALTPAELEIETGGLVGELASLLGISRSSRIPVSNYRTLRTELPTATLMATTRESPRQLAWLIEPNKAMPLILQVLTHS
jgi:hypothetical protein